MWWILIGAACAAFALTPLVGLLGRKLGLIDKPNALSIHQKPVPRVGGLAILVAFAGVVIGAWANGGVGSLSLAAQGAELRSLLGLLIGAALVAAAGLIDDAFHISPLLKFLWQLAGAAVAVGLGVRFGTLPIPGITFAVSLIFLVGMANALNLLDGMNGLATSVTATAALSLAGLAWVGGRPLVAFLALALAGACLGFLPHNYPRARIFMGDVGSLFLGFVLAGLAIMLAQEPYNWPGTMAPLLVLGLPLIDTGLAIVRRSGRSQDVFGGDREHLYDLLSRKGLGDALTTPVMVGLGVALGGLALWVARLSLLPALAVSLCALAALIGLAVWLGALGAGGSRKKTQGSLRQLLRRYGSALALDALVVVAGFYGAMLLRIGYGPDFGRDAALAASYLTSLTAYLPFVVLTYLLVNGFCGVYGRMWRYAGGQETLSIGIASAVSTAGVLLADVLLSSERPIPLSVVLMGGVLSMLGIAAWRYYRQIWSTVQRLNVLFPAPQAATQLTVPQEAEQPQRHTGPYRTLIVGAQREGRQLAALMSKNSQSYEPVGFVDDDPDGVGLRVGGLKVLGNRQSLPDVIEEFGIDMVVLARPHANRKILDETVELCRASNVRVKILPDVYGDLLTDRNAPNVHQPIQIEDLIERPPAQVDRAACRERLAGKTVLVTGAAGSIGSELCRQVVGYGPERLLALDINESGLHNLWLELGKEIDVMIADVRDAARMDQIFEQYRPEAIYHAAAYKHVPLLEQHPSEGFRTNVVGTQTLVEAAARYKAECMIFVSSDKAVYARNVLGASKRVGELVVQSAAQRFRASETVFAAVRFGNVLGSRGSVVPTFERQIQRGGPITVTDPRMTRYFMSIPEAVSLVLQASVYARGGEIFVLDMGTPMRIDELARRMIRLKGLRPGVDIQIEYIGMRPGETLTEELWHPDYEALAPTANPAILCVRDTGSAVNPAALAAEIEKMEHMIGLGQKEQLKAAMYVLSQGTSYKRTTPLSQPAGSTEVLPRSDSVPGSAEPALRPA